MVKIGTGYINPAHVLAVGPEGTAVRVHLGPGIFVDVTGMTPDEVHAKLFPEAVSGPESRVIDVANASAALTALETLSDISPALWNLRGLALLARKALGREVA